MVLSRAGRPILPVGRPNQPDRVSATFVGNTLTIERVSGFVGTIPVRVTVSDGALVAATNFTVTCAAADTSVSGFSVDLAPASDTGTLGDHTTNAAVVTLV